MARVPTERQFRKLAALGGNSIAVAPSFKEWEAAVNRGWVEAAWGYKLEPKRDSAGRRTYWPPLRISAAGLRALADAVDRYGWPEKEDS